MLRAIMYALFFSIIEAARSIKNNKGISVLTVGTISVAMIFIGFFFIVQTNLDRIIEKIKTRSELIVYLRDHFTPVEIKRLRVKLEAKYEIDTIAYISEEDALINFKKNFKWDQSILSGLNENPLPASLVITLKKGFRTTAVMKRVAVELSKFKDVEEVEYGKEWVERLEALISFTQFGIVMLGWLLAAGLLFIVSNTIRLSVYSRLESIEIMKLVGATHRFIKAPFIIEGMIQGFVGALLAIIILYICHQIFINKITQSVKLMLGIQTISFLPTTIIYGILIVGVGFGLIGAHIALRDVIRIRK